jgi:hypothetical protein
MGSVIWGAGVCAIDLLFLYFFARALVLRDISLGWWSKLILILSKYVFTLGAYIYVLIFLEHNPFGVVVGGGVALIMFTFYHKPSKL